ncbi:MAG: L-threonylcarbamoyladenylate synthase [Chloroflexota bacterium]|nr:L-threonylcarbamoyladenylate synthase [Chloroflexota bacterium]
MDGVFLVTRLIEVSSVDPEPALVSEAALVLREGGLVAFPTETVYGLGADALNAEAVARIFRAKGRPSDNPIIVHVMGEEQLDKLTDDVPLLAGGLIREFWPGPLTLIFQKRRSVPIEVTGGLNTVAVRMPRNAVAIALVQALGNPIAAPSANLSGSPSGTTAKHVLQDFNGKIDIVLDGGPVQVGVESTVLDLSTQPPVILRPGAVTRKQLEGVIGEVGIEARKNMLRRSPGTRYRHYSPRAVVRLVKQNDIRRARELTESYISEGKMVGFIGTNIALEPWQGLLAKDMPSDLNEYAKLLFSTLRELDAKGVDVILVEEVNEEGIGIAIMDRLRRAAGINR